MTDLTQLLDTIEGRVDLWEVKDEWRELREIAVWNLHHKRLLERAIQIHEKKPDISVMWGLCLAAYIMNWDDILDRSQEKDLLDDWSELCMSFKEEDWPK